MVLFNSTAFVSIIFCVLLGWPTTSFAQSARAGKTVKTVKAIKAKKRPQSRGAIRYGLGLATIPNTAMLKSSGLVENESKVATEANGVMFSMDYEQRFQRWMISGGGGVGVMGVRAKSLDSGIDYSYSKNTSTMVMVSGTVYYITAQSVRLGAGLKGFYSSYDLPSKSELGTTYTFDYGNNLKSYASVELNWQFSKRILFSQSILSPLSKNSGTGWILALKTVF